MSSPERSSHWVINGRRHDGRRQVIRVDEDTEIRAVTTES